MAAMGLASASLTRAPSRRPRRRAARRPAERHASGHAAAALTVGALGVVFGDIGTSPLYTVQAIFAGPVAPTPRDVRGVFSLLVWTLTLVVSIKYLTLVMRADSDGEGGILALVARVDSPRVAGPRLRAALVIAGLCGVALFAGDGMITPAISVLSAVEGLGVAAPAVKPLVLPLALGVLLSLFAFQRVGTDAVSRLFGPIMLAWFATLGLVGIAQLATHPAILAAVSPSYALLFVAGHPVTAGASLGAVVLAVTGAEALYADMGHFGRPAIWRAWFLVAFPALALNYLGQAALLLQSPRNAGDPFYLLVPPWGRGAMVVLATVATVIASQAVISGAFSLARQAVRLGFLPRLRVRHTSEQAIGQIYVPAINALLLAGVLAIVLAFGSSARLAAAYGLAVTGTFLTTTILFLAIARSTWGWTTRRTAIVGGALLLMDGALFGAGLTKVASGGWLPLLIGLGALLVMTTWRRGRALVANSRARALGPLAAYVEALHTQRPPLQRLPGTAVFLEANPHGTPLALHAQVTHGRALHREVVLCVVVTEPRAHVPSSERIEFKTLGKPDDRIAQVIAHFGYKDPPDVPAALRLAVAQGLPLDVANPSYYVSRSALAVTPTGGMWRWRKHLFVTLAKLAADPVAYFKLPDDSVVVMGSRVTL
jgi:KUP system potassium uptake protein